MAQRNHKRLVLPIDPFEGEFRALLRANRVVLVDAAPGVGKTLRCPEWSMSEGYRTLVTEPRRLAATNAARAVARERGEEVGRLVGFETSKERSRSGQTRLLFATDGLALEREFHGHDWRQVMIIDEVHEWSDRLELLVGLAKRWLAQGQDFKLVLMSATMDVPALRKFFWDAPVLSIPGVRNPLEQRKPGRSVEEDVATLVREGRSVLVFHSGKRAIARTMEELRRMQLGAQFFELHGDMKFEKQDQAFSYQGQKVVVSTPIAQASVTVPGINAVVDTGLEKRIEIRNGVEALIEGVISQADSTQRWGRSNRQGPGVVIDRCPMPFEQRPEYSLPEIERRRLDGPILKLARMGIQAEEFEFFHPPTERRLTAARAVLRSFGCMAADGTVTSVGHQVARIPLSIPFARMVAAAQNMSNLPEVERQAVVNDVITVAALCEVGGVTEHTGSMGWVDLIGGEDASDWIAQLRAYKSSARTFDQKRAAGIHTGRYAEVKERVEDILDSKVKTTGLALPINREAVIEAVCAGFVDRLYRRVDGRYQGERPDDRREIGRESIVRGGEWLVALPLDLEVDGRRGGKITLRLLRMVTRVEPEMLIRVAPHLVRIESGIDPAYDPNRDCVVSTKRTFFRGHLFKAENPGHLLKEERVPDPTHPQAAAIFASWVASQMA